MTKKAGEDLLLAFNSSWTGVFVKLKPPLKISRSTTGMHYKRVPAAALDYHTVHRDHGGSWFLALRLSAIKHFLL